MLLGNRTTRKGMEIEEPIDIVLKYVNTTGDSYSNEGTHYESSVHCFPSQSSAAHSPRKDSSLQLSSMTLKLIPVFIYAPKEVGTPVYIEHYSFALLALPSIKVSPHLNPFGLEKAAISSPLPPFLASYFVNAVMPELCYKCVCSFRETFLRYRDLVNSNPAGTGNPLRRKALYIFDCMMGSIGKELADEVHAFVVRDMGSGLLTERLSIEVLWAL